MTSEEAWFAAENPVEWIRSGTAAEPADWAALAVESGVAADEGDYEEMLHEATTTAAREAVRERERADDAQLIHAIRAADDARRVANELAERVAEWGGSLFELSDSAADATDDRRTTAETEPLDESATNASSTDESATNASSTDESATNASSTDESGIAYARAIADREPTGPLERRVVSLAERVAELADEADELESFVERHAPVAAPNLSALAGPTLAARLIALAGGLESLAQKPSGTLQVLGAEDALFAHLRGHAPSPKHGVIFTHPYVRETRPADRGSAARALAGKLTIAARIDHYAGDRRPELERELDERIARIRARDEEGD